MMTFLKQATILLLMLFVQLQPVQVHAVILDAEQDGHVAGMLSHSHHHEMEESSHHSGAEDHSSDCHPAHTLSPPTIYAPGIHLSHQTASEQQTTGLLSVHIALDPPPPKLA